MAFTFFVFVKYYVVPKDYGFMACMMCALEKVHAPGGTGAKRSRQNLEPYGCTKLICCVKKCAGSGAANVAGERVSDKKMN